jgi:chemotaxis protein MotB
VFVKSRIADTDDTLREAQCWLPTYAALCMAFLAFFVLLYSLSAPDARKEISQTQMRNQVIEMQTHAFNDIRAFIAQNDLAVSIQAALQEASIILLLSEAMLFTPGSEQILPTGFTTLNQLKELFIIQYQQTINIRGYTDDSPPPPGARFKDNWELSTLRAMHILRHLLAQGIEPWRLTATGLGAFEPLFPNTTENNRAKNRRVEFVLERRLGKE